MFPPASRKVKTLGNLAMIVSGDVAATLATASLVTVGCSGGWRDWDQVGAGGRVGLARSLAVLAGPDWRTCIGFCQSGAAGLVLCRGSRHSLSTWTWRRATDDAIEVMLLRILSRSTVPGPGASLPPETSGMSCSALSVSSTSMSSALSLDPE